MTILDVLKQMLNITGNQEDDYLSSLISSTIDTLKTYHINPLLTVYEYSFDNSLENRDCVVFKTFRVNFSILGVKEVAGDGNEKDIDYVFNPTTMVLRFKRRPAGRVYVRFQRGYASEDDVPFLLKLAVAKLAYLSYYETRYGGLVSSDQSVDGVRNTYKDFNVERQRVLREIMAMMGGEYAV